MRKIIGGLMGNAETFKKVKKPVETIECGGTCLEKVGPGQYSGVIKDVKDEAKSCRVDLRVGRATCALNITFLEGTSEKDHVWLHTTLGGRILSGYIGSEKLLDYLGNIETAVQQIRGKDKDLPESVKPFGMLGQDRPIHLS